MVRAVVDDNADDIADQIDRGLTKEKAKETLETLLYKFPLAQ
jgi:hypothetical protein